MSHKRRIQCGVMILLSGLTVSGGAVAADAMGAQQIMERNYFATKVKSFVSDSTMLLINDRGQTRERRTATKTKLQDNAVDSKILVKFLSPPDIKGTGFLQIQHSDGDDDQWIYLPALKKSRRLVANNKKDSFMGSDFSYGDILLPRWELYRHTLLRTEPIEGQDCYVIESVPNEEPERRNSGYSRRISWIRKDNAVEMKVEYYDLAGRLLKTQNISGHKLMEPDTQRWIALRREMKNHQTGHVTVFTFGRVDARERIGDEFFTTRALERE